MRLGGATGAPPASRSRNHDRSQPAPPPPMLSQRGFRGRPLPTSIPIPGALVTTSNAPRRTTAAAPSTPLCFATGSGGGSGSRSATRPALRCRDLEHAITILTTATQPARQANACHAGCFRSFHIERPTASRPRTRVTKPTPAARRAPPDRYVRARLRCSSRASLPLTPRLARLLQPLECALPLRSGKDKVS